MNEKSIGKQIAKGTFWTVLMRIAIRLLGIISVLITARVLVPEDFGIVAKAVLISNFLDLITQFGFDAALIKNQQATKDDYNTVWTITIFRALILSFSLVLGAAYIAEYFNEPEIEYLIYCYAVSMMILGFTNVGIVNFRKQMEFNKDFKFNVFKKVSSFITTISIAVYWQSYWAFPIGVLVGTIVSVSVSYILSSYRPSITLKSWHSLFHFSKWMFGYEVVGAVAMKLDTFLLSRYSSGAELGAYTIAYEVSGTPSTEISMPVARASLPGLAKLNGDIGGFRDLYVSILSLVLLIAIPAATGLSVLSEEVTAVLLGAKWKTAAPLISILALFGVTRVFISCAVSALVAFDRADLLAKFSLFSLLIRLILLPISIVHIGGALGISQAILASGILASALILGIQSYIGILSIRKVIRNIWRIIISTLIMYLYLLYFVENFLLIEYISIYWVLFIDVLVGIIVFTTSIALLCKISSIKGSPEEKVILMVRDRLNS